MIYLLQLLLVVLLTYTGVCTVYLLLFAIAGHFKKKTAFPTQPASQPQSRIAVLIPAYREDAVIVEVARQALIQSYDKNYFEVIIIADSLQSETLRQLQTYPVRVITVHFPESTKAKALNTALHQLPDYDIALVLDADNIMDFCFLEKIHQPFVQGSQVVQGHRVAKNTNTAVAVLDAISEEINNHIFRKGHRSIGLSAALIGSGMAFEYRLFKRLMTSIHTTGGFDKELELLLLKQKYTIEYLEDALVYDEKVQHTQAFRQQRTRWIAAQLKYLKRYFVPGLQALIVKGNIDFFDKVCQMTLLPRILLMGFLGMICLITGIINTPSLLIAGILQLSGLMIAMLLATPMHLLTKISWKEILSLPVLFIQFILSFTGIRQARSKFIHTEHGKMK
ncbi:glycosyltransferase family 2 protein [Rhodocytophaga rosea]|uniref:Glycosyltransferase family 2 protein n=1 Tax=Rhodocytophaga rosea TaxID=2704465 RepID=A0A6C0GNH2_9BACT|nr:glycosyltransferase [Rhodocytophaga rosea]QHT69394.1 glycosyltransferase family 2 protein [Rhodocytophaga rosea]